MCPPSVSSIADIGWDITPKELFMLLEDIRRGSPLPSNVIRDINPCPYLPSNLPEHVWYLKSSGWNEDTELGIWKAKGEKCELFSNSAITGWRTTREYFEGQVPHERKTDWLMQEYWVTPKGLGESSKAKEASSLCRIFLRGENGIDLEKELQATRTHVASETQSNSTQSFLPEARNDHGDSFRRNIEVDNDDETRLAVAGTPLNHHMENVPELRCFHEGDYLELFDLEIPASPSSSSDNSSCVTMSSDECFDSLALLRDLESESNRDLMQKDKDCNLSVSAAPRADEMLMLPPSPGAFIGIEESRPAGEEIPRNEPSMPGLVYCDKGTSSSSHTTSPNGGKKADKNKMKKLTMKYLCFMLF